jgi:hypothetical protein
MRQDRLPLKGGDECDWVSKNWRRLLCVFHNHTGLGKKIKRRLNKRARHKNRQEMRDGTRLDSW